MLAVLMSCCRHLLSERPLEAQLLAKHTNEMGEEGSKDSYGPWSVLIDVHHEHKTAPLCHHAVLTSRLWTRRQVPLQSLK